MSRKTTEIIVSYFSPFLTVLSFLLLNYLLQSTLLKTGISVSGSVALSETVLGIAAFFLYRCFRRNPSANKLSWITITVCILTGISIAVPTALRRTQADTVSVSLISCLAYGIIAPVTEELVYRGLVLLQTQPVLDSRIAVLLSSVLFAAGHPQQWTSALLFGLLSGFLFVKYSILTYPIIVHVSVNLFSFISISNLSLFQAVS